MKKSGEKLIVGILLTFIIFSALSLPVFAASAGISINKASIAPGDTIEITVKVSDKNVFGIRATLKYDSSMLQYIKGTDTNGGNGNVNIQIDGDSTTSSLSTKITFKALKSGTSNLSFTVTEAFNFDLKELSKPSAKKSITIKPKAPKDNTSGSTTKPETKKPEVNKPKDEEPEQKEPDVNPVDTAIKIDVKGIELYLWKDISKVKIPEGFKTKEISYKAEKIQGASANDINIVYFTNKDGKNGNFYIMDEKENFYPLINLNTNSTYTPLPLDSSAEIPEGYVESEIDLKGEKIVGWFNEEIPNFYLLYVMNPKGEKDFYLYDQSEETMQRYNERTIVIEVEKEPAPMTLIEKITNDKNLLIVLGLLAGLSLILLISLVVLYRRLGKLGKH